MIVLKVDPKTIEVKCVYVCVCVYVHNMYGCVYTQICVFLCLYLHMHACMHVRVFMCIQYQVMEMETKRFYPCQKRIRNELTYRAVPSLALSPFLPLW